MGALRSPLLLLPFIPEFLSLKQSEESEASANPSPVPHRHPLSTLRLCLAPRVKASVGTKETSGEVPTGVASLRV
ncbi:hypothetical protein J1N35_003814 [Gossypium stocksii]|uniref:Uncharacterized protein n=1 Tax=Gossypium stocksii TaxID=47602 RepID=A0A9D3WAA3_9ROSI|nr:hypothetical protein J1N35_003814 [Gossypium stocksii]